MTEFRIETPVVQAAFLAQVGHESEGLLYFRELWGRVPTVDQARYERDFKAPWPGSPAEAQQDRFKVNRKAYGLGNSIQGDGRKYMGRGPIQITGRGNCRIIGGILRIDLESDPVPLEGPTVGCRSAGAFWQWKQCQPLAESGDFIALTRRINGGTNGLADRQQRWAKAKAALGVT